MIITIQGDRFVNENGGQILFNGVNSVCKYSGSVSARFAVQALRRQKEKLARRDGLRYDSDR